MKVVLDTNIFISAFLWQGMPSRILQLVKSGEITMCVSQEIIEEYQAVLGYSKLAKQLKQIDKLPQNIMNELTEVVEYYPGEKFQVDIIHEDPSDNKFIACALAAQASFIISGDQHLLNIRDVYNIHILSPSAFLKLHKESGFARGT